METVIGLIIGIAISAVISGFIIWLVSKMNLGLHVDNFWWAMAAGLIIGAVTNLLTHLLPIGNEIVQVIVNLVIAAAVIFGCGSLLSGMTVKGFGGALVAAIAISVVSFLLLLVVLGGASVVGQPGNA